MWKTHAQLVKREVKKFSAEWLVKTEVRYGSYIFDILGVNLKTKEVEIVEVDLTNDTNEKKIEFAKTLGNIRIVKNTDNENFKIPVESFQQIINALGDPMRVAILQVLANHGVHDYSSLMYELQLNPKKHAGRFVYHLKLLLNSQLITVGDGKYEITPKGREILVFFRELMPHLNFLDVKY